MKKATNKLKPRYVPDYMADSIEDIDFAKLAHEGIKYIVLDADNTLVPNFGTVLGDRDVDVLRNNLKQFDQNWIATNRLMRNLQPLADSIGVKLFQATPFIRKPQKRYFKRLLRKMGAKPKEVLMIGDSLVADIWGAKKAGMQTLLVKPAGRDFILVTLLQLRLIERYILKRYYANKN